MLFGRDFLCRGAACDAAINISVALVLAGDTAVALKVDAAHLALDAEIEALAGLLVAWVDDEVTLGVAA